MKKSCVAACPVEWPDGRGISGRMRVEWVAGSAWNRWSDAHGMGGQMTVESATELLTEETALPYSILRRQADQPTWQDSQSGYIRRQVAERKESSSSELIEIDLPPATRVDYPQWHSNPYHQRVWLLEGALEVLYGDERYSMQPGDVLEFAVDRPVSYISGQDDGCRYLLNLLYQ